MTYLGEERKSPAINFLNPMMRISFPNFKVSVVRGPCPNAHCVVLALDFDKPSVPDALLNVRRNVATIAHLA